ncbi:uncharacterized protein V1510DRAFT_411205 [Dipodascopsis tothii]|uniref:uncharacterized protein n=1 Tax=Dipodascopsis tothii TaxID=44089 RepID=UPI0034CF7FE1
MALARAEPAVDVPRWQRSSSSSSTSSTQSHRHRRTRTRIKSPSADEDDYEDDSSDLGASGGSGSGSSTGSGSEDKGMAQIAEEPEHRPHEPRPAAEAMYPNARARSNTRPTDDGDDSDRRHSRSHGRKHNLGSVTTAAATVALKSGMDARAKGGKPKAEGGSASSSDSADMYEEDDNSDDSRSKASTSRLDALASIAMSVGF